MPFLSASFYNFRNLENATVDISSPEVFLVGKNGQGKTNFLEALYVSSYGTSFRTRSLAQICTRDEKEFSVRALYKENDQISHTISIIIQDKKKDIQKNFKKIKNSKELISTVPCILFHGDDIEFAVGTPSRKRFFIDQSVSLCNSDFIETLVRYSKALKSRNVILEQKKASLLDSIDEIFASLALLITNERKNIVDEYSKHFSSIYEEISGVYGVEMVYRPSIKVESEEDLLILLAEKRQNDLIDRTSSTGPHRDRIHFIKDKKPFTERASNGQRRLISLVLRMIQAKIYSEKTCRKPIFLMDDILLELDPEKRQKFMELLPPYEQLFCTFLPGEPYKNYQKETTKIFFVEDGRFSAERG
ncbi:DNA replication/repair protein RecF [Treponema sp. OMZ 788]|uniref:DNA replication/repair protein RecF n=1 Tax=Treponema sp. OMZ 788 TaxID=2563664 RepID=UPI0020A45AB8|nr:DNA replication and repair protein RecF [Treponema sp. OMZ 788]UTC64462.1 DNA replication/repair protein RecF [Treponema sp. OMZ 788]